MEFKQFAEIVRDNASRMAEGQERLFEVDVARDEVWEHYLASFPPGTNQMFRERTEHDCSACRHFVQIGRAHV